MQLFQKVPVKAAGWRNRYINHRNMLSHAILGPFLAFLPDISVLGKILLPAAKSLDLEYAEF